MPAADRHRSRSLEGGSVVAECPSQAGAAVDRALHPNAPSTSATEPCRAGAPT